MKEYLISKGYQKINDGFLEQWISPDHRVTLTEGLSNRPGSSWTVHVDSEDFSTIGTLDVLGIKDLEEFLGLCGIKN